MHNISSLMIKDLFGSMPDLLADPEKVNLLSITLSNSIHAQEKLAAGFHKKLIGPTEFQKLAQEEHKRVLAEVKEIIGAAKFYEVFGEEGDHPELVANPEPFFTAFGR